MKGFGLIYSALRAIIFNVPRLLGHVRSFYTVVTLALTFWQQRWHTYRSVATVDRKPMYLCARNKEYKCVNIDREQSIYSHYEKQFVCAFVHFCLSTLERTFPSSWDATTTVDGFKFRPNVSIQSHWADRIE